MKRRDLIQHLERHGCCLQWEGSRHSIYENHANSKGARPFLGTPR
jgi:hypothetical protein